MVSLGIHPRVQIVFDFLPVHVLQYLCRVPQVSSHILEKNGKLPQVLISVLMYVCIVPYDGLAVHPWRFLIWCNSGPSEVFTEDEYICEYLQTD